MRRIAGCVLSLAVICALAVTPAISSPTFGAPVTMPGSQSTLISEPGIDIANDGTVLVNGPVGFPGHSKMWRSTNGGGSFTSIAFPTPFNRLPGGGDSDVAVSDSGRVYFADLWVGSNSVTRSDNYGATWAIGTPYSSLPLSDRQWLAVGKPGLLAGDDTVFIAYSTIEANLFVSRSDNSGVAWTTNVPIVGSSGFSGNIVADKTGFVGLVSIDGAVVRLKYSAANGDANTWRSADIGENAWDRSPPSVALAGNDLYATWIDTGTNAVMVSQSTLADPTTWSTPVVLSTGGSNVYSWIDARGSKAAVAWYGTDAGVASPDANVGPWFVRYSESTNGGATFSTPVNVASSTVKTTIICTNGVGCPNLGHDGRELGDFMQLAIDGNGKSLVTYVDTFGLGGITVEVAKQN